MSAALPPSSPKAHAHAVPLDYSFMGLATLSGSYLLSLNGSGCVPTFHQELTLLVVCC